MTSAIVKTVRSLLCEECRTLLCRHLFLSGESMAWRSHGEDNSSLVNNLYKNKIIKSEEVRAAMASVDRGNYIKENPYIDRPQPLGYNVTISAPHMHAHALQLLQEQLR